MKTILVIFTDQKLEDASKMKRYSFNTARQVEVGDLIESPAYKTKLQVVEVLNACFTNVNIRTGELTDKETSSIIYPIRELPLETSGEEDNNTPQK